MKFFPLRPLPENDPRFTIELAIDTAAVLEKHGFPKIEAGGDWLDLQQALFSFLYGERVTR